MKNYVRFSRQEQGITQKDFAKMIGVTRQTIGALENNRYNPSLKLAYKITRVLGKTSIEEVFILTDDDL
ncbi:MAG: helix-turn-helix transcriptional regulator [archaeon]|nr:helix-turn-helix transcriptional regulator [archaeon]